MFGFLEVRKPHQWSTTDKDATFAIAANGTTITGGGGGTASFVSARCGQSLAINQKLYVEFKVLAVDAGGYGCGFSNPSAPLTSYLGADANAITYYSTGTFSYNGLQAGAVDASSTVNDVCCVAIDGINQKIWVRINAGNWNANVITSENPATNLGGFACSGVFVTRLLVGVSSNNTTMSLSLNAGSSAFAQTPPVGFRSPNSAVNV